MSLKKNLIIGVVVLAATVVAALAVQVFATVTKAPPALNYDENTADADQVTALVILQRLLRYL